MKVLVEFEVNENLLVSPALALALTLDTVLMDGPVEIENLIHDGDCKGQRVLYSYKIMQVVASGELTELEIGR